MWKHNILFRAEESIPIAQTENELFHETDPALDSSGLQLEKYISVWLPGDGEETTPTVFTNVYVRTATLDPVKQVGFLQPLQGRSHQIKKMLTADQKCYLREWLKKAYPRAWEDAEEHFHNIFQAE